MKIRDSIKFVLAVHRFLSDSLVGYNRLSNLGIVAILDPDHLLKKSYDTEKCHFILALVPKSTQL